LTRLWERETCDEERYVSSTGSDGGSGDNSDCFRPAINQTVAGEKTAVPADEKVAAGYRLFDHNCAHCHGDDARGDEGPSLYDLRKSDARLEKIIKDGIKGERPSFNKKFNDEDVQLLIAYIRTLKENDFPALRNSRRPELRFGASVFFPKKITDIGIFPVATIHRL
jgi:mono/diheme cytochrome c family protein